MLGSFRRLVTACHQPAAWPHTCIADTAAAHLAPLCAALYNSLFQVVRDMPVPGVWCMPSVRCTSSGSATAEPSLLVFACLEVSC